MKRTNHTPSVYINRKCRSIYIEGNSQLEDPSVFYQPLDDMIEKNLARFKSTMIVNIRLNYINTSSSKWLFHILKNLQIKHLGKKIITVNWYYEADDESIEEAGEVFQSLLNLPFNLIKE